MPGYCLWVLSCTTSINEKNEKLMVTGLSITIVLARSSSGHWDKIIEKCIQDGSWLIECRAFQIKARILSQL